MINFSKIKYIILLFTMFCALLILLCIFSCKYMHKNIINYNLCAWCCSGSKQCDLQERRAPSDRQFQHWADLPRIFLQSEERFADRAGEGAGHTGETRDVHGHEFWWVQAVHKDERSPGQISGGLSQISQLMEWRWLILGH